LIGGVMIRRVEREIADRNLSLESGLMAKQAHGAVTVRYGDSMILATVVRDEPREGIDFFPLTVDYREKTASAGRIPGGYFKREGRPTEKEILSMRQIDRPVRPLFPDGYKEEVQIMISVLSADEFNDPDVLGLIGASAALSISPIPWQGPLGAVRIGRVDEHLIVNPSYEQLQESTLNLVVAGTKDAITMVEGGAKEESEEVMLEALQLAQEKIRSVVEMIEEFAGKHDVKKVEFEPPKVEEDLLSRIRSSCEAGIEESIKIADKAERNEAISQLVEKTIEEMTGDIEDKDEKTARARQIKSQIKEMEKQAMRRMIIEQSRRIDGRGMEDIRSISINMDYLPRVHGSALFTRGQTQALASATLGTSSDEQRIDALIGEVKKRFK